MEIGRDFCGDSESTDMMEPYKNPHFPNFQVESSQGHEDIQDVVLQS